MLAAFPNFFRPALFPVLIIFSASPVLFLCALCFETLSFPRLNESRSLRQPVRSLSPTHKSPPKCTRHGAPAVHPVPQAASSESPPRTHPTRAQTHPPP